MCGFVGILGSAPIGDIDRERNLISTMRDRLAHRGPDDSGNWFDPGAGLALGFRRLSIVDLSPAGHQPMLSADGRFAIVMNGEIYNHAALRAELEQIAGGARPWSGHCDTEVLVEAIAVWGVEATVARLNGMFAFAVWDRQRRTLWLGRDRIGKKPLYYGWAGDSFIFGSELKALWPHPAFDFEISQNALADFMRLGYVLGTQTIFASTFKLGGGHLLRLDPASAGRCMTPAPLPYWRLRDVAIAGLEAQAAGRRGNQEELEALISDAVRCRMVADVPVGSFLSGGVDSTLITALMQEGAAEPVRSFAIGFDAPEWDEAPHAAAVAAHLGTRHEATYMGLRQLAEVVRDLPRMCDEPFADDSILPTALLCRIARRDVTVALSGDGGDELFAGYQRYASADRWLRRRTAVPPAMRRVADGVIDRVALPAAARWGSHKMERRVRLLHHLLRDGDPEAFQSVIMSQSLNSDTLLTHPSTAADPLMTPAYALGQSNAIDRMTFMDTASFLVDDILAKVDRASMSVSLEVRCPLLDHRVIAMSWLFPTYEKASCDQSKLPLRRMLYRYVPPAMVDRPKVGFSAPIVLWLRHELRDWAEALMSRPALASHNLLNVAACRRLWEDFASGKRGWDRAIWNLLMFQAWHASLQELISERAGSARGRCVLEAAGAQGPGNPVSVSRV